MPTIKNYQSQVRTPGPPARSNLRAIPGNFGAMEAQATGKLGTAIQSTAGVLAKRIEQEEVSSANAAMAKFQAEKAMELQNIVRKAEPGDSKVFQDYDDRLKEDLVKVGEEYSTPAAKSYYAGAAARIQGQLLKTSSSALAESKATRAVLDYSETRNNLSASLMADPTSFELQRDLHHAAIENLVDSGLMPAAKGAELKQQGETDLAKAATRGWIKLDPAYAKEKLNTGIYDNQLGAEGKRQLLAEADSEIRGREAEEARKRTRAKELKKEQDNLVQGKFLDKLVQGDLTWDEVSNSTLDSVGSGSKDQFRKMIEARNKAPQKTNPAVFRQVFERIHLPADDPRKISDENALNEFFVAGSISKDDLVWARKEISGLNSPEGKRAIELKKNFLDKVAKSKIAKSSLFRGLDPVGEEKYQAFLTDFHTEYYRQKQDGKTDRELFDPNSKEYLGWMIDNYTRSIQEVIRDRTNSIRGNTIQRTETQMQESGEAKAKTRKKGESQADYLKRMGL